MVHGLDDLVRDEAFVEWLNARRIEQLAYQWRHHTPERVQNRLHAARSCLCCAEIEPEHEITDELIKIAHEVETEKLAAGRIAWQTDCRHLAQSTRKRRRHQHSHQSSDSAEAEAPPVQLQARRQRQ